MTSSIFLGLRFSRFVFLLTAFLFTGLVIATAAHADAAAFGECALKKLKEMLEIATITWIIGIVVEHGINKLAEIGGEVLLKKIATALGKKIIPWLGAALIIFELLLLIKDCLPLLVQ